MRTTNNDQVSVIMIRKTLYTVMNDSAVSAVAQSAAGKLQC